MLLICREGPSYFTDGPKDPFFLNGFIYEEVSFDLENVDMCVGERAKNQNYVNGPAGYSMITSKQS